MAKRRPQSPVSVLARSSLVADSIGAIVWINAPVIGQIVEAIDGQDDILERGVSAIVEFK